MAAAAATDICNTSMGMSMSQSQAKAKVFPDTDTHRQENQLQLTSIAHSQHSKVLTAIAVIRPFSQRL